jgi:hypothetical protein
MEWQIPPEAKMTDHLDHSNLQSALALLSDRNYGEEGIPMMLVLENVSRVVAGVDPSTGCLGPLLREAAKGAGPHKGEHGAADLARVIEWIADSTFGPAALVRNGDEARDG